MTKPIEDEPLFIFKGVKAELRATSYGFEPTALISTTNTQELFSLDPDEALTEAITRRHSEQKAEASVHRLTADELENLRNDMANSSRWIREELRRRKARKGTR